MVDQMKNFKTYTQRHLFRLAIVFAVLLLSMILTLPAGASAAPRPCGSDTQKPALYGAHSKAIDLKVAYRKANDAKVKAKVKEVVKQCITPSMTDYEKALTLHDWLCDNASYDYDFKYYYADGVLLYGTGVCQSYALAYELLCKEAKLGVYFLAGKVYPGKPAGHAWNIVRMDGKWYHVDCTWDDPGSGKKPYHEYFGLPDQQIAREHFGWTPSNIKCNSVENCYWYKNGRYDELVVPAKKIIQSHLDQGTTAFTVDERDYYGTEYGAPFIDGIITTMLSNMDWTYANASIKLNVTRNRDNTFTVDLVKVPVKKIAINKASSTLKVGAMLQLSIAFGPTTATDKQIKWSSSNPKIVTVDANGLVTGIKKGTVTITAKSGNGKKATKIITVK